MSDYTAARLVQAYAVNARIEGMKAANTQHPDCQPYAGEHFLQAEQELEELGRMILREGV